MTKWAFMKPHAIHGPDGKLYLWRLRIIQTPWFALYLHHIIRPDADRYLHDHPWNFISIVLRGWYCEEVSPGVTEFRNSFTAKFHRAESLHKIWYVAQNTWTLCICGRRRREWGFATDEGWVHWQEFETNSDTPRGEK